MSFLGRFLGGRSNAFSEGLALLEEERFAEAADRFRIAVTGRSDAPSASLASFHFRQALVSEGRRLMRADQAEQAVPYFEEAVQHWDLYPDLHCLLGTAQGKAGDWDLALQEARTALRLNPDYVEARLLEAVTLTRLERDREAIDSLQKLREAGRRVDHWLIASLDDEPKDEAPVLPENLMRLLDQSMSGRSEKEEVATAVAQCRAGNWEDGLVRFAALVTKRPRYPDYRTRHAAAFFQLGRNEEALAEVEAALALNENYRTAIDLKGLILADLRRIRDAHDFLRASDARLEPTGEENTQEDLFGAYLRGALALLCGEPESVGGGFVRHRGLVRDFARAELLLAAADDLLDRPTSSGERVNRLVDEWPGEADYFFLLACHHLEAGRYQEATSVLGRWPAAQGLDSRPLYLQQLTALKQGNAFDGEIEAKPDDRVTEDAWRVLKAGEALRHGDPGACWSTVRELLESGMVTERIVHLALQAAGADPELIDPDWAAPAVIPEASLAATVHLYHLQGRGQEATELLAKHRAVHPQMLRSYWLSPEFWLDPIRTWIG